MCCSCPIQEFQKGIKWVYIDLQPRHSYDSHSTLLLGNSSLNHDHIHGNSKVNFPSDETKELKKSRVSPGLRVFIAALQELHKLDKKRKKIMLRLQAMNDHNLEVYPNENFR